MSNNLIELLEKLTGNMELNLGGLRDQLRAELAALKAGQGEAVAEVSPESYSSDGTSDIITRNLPIGTKLYKAPPTATIQDEANRRPQTCNGRSCSWCKEGAEPCHYTAPPASADDVSVPRELLRDVCSLIPEKMKTARKELRALLAQSKEVK